MSTTGRFQRLRARARALQDAQRRLETRVERRWPRLYDARHAASGLGRLVGPLIGPLLFALLVLPLIALIAGLLALLGAVGVDLPAVQVPDLIPDVALPGWLRSALDAVGDVLAGIGSVLATVAHWLKWPVIALLVVTGLYESRQAMRRRAAAEAVGRAELTRRLAVALRRVEARATERGAATVGAAAEDRSPDR